MKSRDDIRSFVIGMVSDHLNRSPEQVAAGLSFEALGADSLDKVEIIMACEEEFSVLIDDGEAEAIDNALNMMHAIHAAMKRNEALSTPRGLL